MCWTVLFVPLLPYVAGWDAWPIYLHPVQAPLVLLRAAVEPLAGWQIAYALLYSVGAIGLLYRRVLVEWKRFVLVAL